MCFNYEPTSATLRANHATCILMAFLCERDLGGKQICIKIGLTNKVMAFVNGDDSTVLCATGRMLLVCNVRLASVSSV